MSEALKEANVTSELISVLNRCEAAFAILAATGDKNCKELLADIRKAKEAALSESAEPLKPLSQYVKGSYTFSTQDDRDKAMKMAAEIATSARRMISAILRDASQVTEGWE